MTQSENNHVKCPYAAGTGVLETTACVLDSPSFVNINKEKLVKLCAQWASHPFLTPPWDTTVHYTTENPQELANYIVLLDCLNFCFWPDQGQERWQIDFQGQRFGGYNALAASLKRAALEGVPVTEARWMSQVSEEDLDRVFRGSSRIPLMEKRLENVRQTGSVLLNEFDGQFANAILSCDKCAPALANLMADRFASFNDTAEYRGNHLRIMKRAQITVADIFGSFAGRGLGEFRDIDKLTAYADYKIPQVLRALGILEYSPDLAALVDNYQLITAGSPMEVEIRVSMIWAVEYICRELKRLGTPRLPYELDWFLWNLGQEQIPDLRPYHRVRTIFY